MGSTVSIELRFAKEKHARWAAHIVENLVKLSYAPVGPIEFDPELERASLSELCLRHEELLSSFDLLDQLYVTAASDCALSYLRRDRTRVILDRCADVQWMAAPYADEPDDFFTQLCFALALRFPQMRFTGYTRYEMTVSGSVEHTRASYNRERLQFRRIVGERPLDEHAWDTWEVYDWVAKDGRFVRRQGQPTALQRHFCALLDDAREAASAGDVRAALRFVEDAMALPNCENRLEALLCRMEIGRVLRRRKVRDFVHLTQRELPASVGSMPRVPFSEMSLDVGSHVLRWQAGHVQDVDTATDEVGAELAALGRGDDLFLVDGNYLVQAGDAIETWHLVVWDYE